MAGFLDGERHQTLKAPVVDDDDLAGPDIPEVFRPHQVEGAGFRGHRPAAVEAAQSKRPESAGVADGNDPVPGQHDDAVGPLHARKRLCQGLFQPLLQMGGHQMDDHLAVHGGLEDRSLLLELRPKFGRVDQVSVVGQCVVLVGMVDQKGLSVREDRGACGGIADVADGRTAGKSGKAFLPEHLGGEPHRLVRPDLASVRRCDPGTFLPAVLERKKPEEGHTRRLFVTVNRKDAALLARAAFLGLPADHPFLFSRCHVISSLTVPLLPLHPTLRRSSPREGESCVDIGNAGPPSARPMISEASV